MTGHRDKRPLRRRYSSMGGPTMPDPNGSTTVDNSSSDKPTSLGLSMDFRSKCHVVGTSSMHSVTVTALTLL
jgi:hypothetical protein